MRHGGEPASVSGWTLPSRSTGRTRIAASFATRTRRGRGSCSSRPAAAGRPAAPPRLDLAGLRFRARCVRVAREDGIAAALALGVSRASLHRWRTATRPGASTALVDRPRGPAPGSPAGVGRAGGHRRPPAHVLEQQAPGGRVHDGARSSRSATTRSTRLLADLGTARPSTRREHGPAYERGRPNELWHIDIKGPFFLRRPGRVREGLDRRPRRRPFPVPHRAARPAAAPGRTRSSPGSTTASSCAARRSS